MSGLAERRTELATIAAGGVAGALLRWTITELGTNDDGGWFEYAPTTTATFSPELGFPARTLIVNLLGCLFLGGLTWLLRAEHTPARRRILVGLATGFCGSLTTFSTFAADTADLLGARSPADTGTAIAYVAASLIGGAAAFVIGRTAARTAAS